MGSREISTTDDPATPVGRLFLRPELDTIIHCAIGLKNHIDVEAMKSIFKNSVAVKHPRFCSLPARDKHGVEHWRRTEVDVDRHFIIVDPTTATTNTAHGNHDSERIINDDIADLSVSTPLSNDKPLWEVHILMEQKCAIFRIHHALGDGTSLMSMLVANCRKADDPSAVPTVGSGSRRDSGRVGSGRHWRGILLAFLKMVFFSFIVRLDFALRSLWVRDRKTAITGGAGVELWPRKLATAGFRIEDMNAVKKAVPNTTIDDVLSGVISSGLSRYLDHRTPKALRDGLRITGVAMVNLRERPGLLDLPELMKSNSGSRWGNMFGVVLLPVYYRKAEVDPLEHVKRAKKMMDRKKQTLEAHFSYAIGSFILSWFGSKAACWFIYKMLCNTTFLLSNIVGPKEEITIGGNPITFLRITISAMPHALTMHMVRYAGRADMQILVAKDIIPEPEFLARCFEDALREMNEAAASSA